MYSLCTKENNRKNQADLGASFSYGEGGPSGPFHNKNTKGSVPGDRCSISHSIHTEYMI